MSCAPAVGGSSPGDESAGNAVATDQGATNQIPPSSHHRARARSRFPIPLTCATPMAACTISSPSAGRGDASGCNAEQPNFQQADGQNNMIFRIPTHRYGGGLIETIPETRHPGSGQRAERPEAQDGDLGRPEYVMHGNTIRAASTPAATTEQSHGLDGKRRTSRSKSLPGKPTTSRWVSPTNSSRTSAIKRPVARTTASRKTLPNST